MQITHITGGTSKLTAILEDTLPHVKNTANSYHLAQIKPDPHGFGKVVNFRWDRKDFRLDTKLKVQEYSFGLAARNCLMTNEMTEDLECRFQAPFIKEEKRLLKNANERKRKAAIRAAKKAADLTASIEQEKTEAPALVTEKETVEA